MKQKLAVVRMLFDWLVTGPDGADQPGRGRARPQYVVQTGKTPVLEGDEWRKLLNTIPTATVRDLRDRVLIATLTYFPLHTA